MPRRCYVQVGKRLTRVCMLAGSIVRVWGTLEAVLGRHTYGLPKFDRTLRVVRASLADGASLIGAHAGVFICFRKADSTQEAAPQHTADLPFWTTSAWWCSGKGTAVLDGSQQENSIG